VAGPHGQCDPSLPERFDLAYRGADGAEHRPIMVHRAILGTFERFMALIIEHYAGHFPLWLSPVQAVIIPINEENIPYCEGVLAQLKAAGLRAELDDRNESLNYRIRERSRRSRCWSWVARRKVPAPSPPYREPAGAARQEVIRRWSER
jgi:threonyl-tRNA synthetase